MECAGKSTGLLCTAPDPEPGPAAAAVFPWPFLASLKCTSSRVKEE